MESSITTHRDQAEPGRPGSTTWHRIRSAFASFQREGVNRLRMGRSGKFRPVVIAFLTPVLIGLFLSAFQAGAIKNITIIADGQAVNLTTRENLVGEALSSANIEFDQDDLVMPPSLALLEDGEVITVRRVSRETVLREIPIPFQTNFLDNSRLRVGSEVELRSGQTGLKREVVQRETLDGVVTRDEVVSSEVVVQPISRKVYRGTRTTGQTVSSLKMQATAYTAGAESCWPYVDGLTAVLKKAGYGVAAVDPSRIHLGTRLYIDGYGFAIACDVGGAIRGDRIDLFMSDVDAARRFGRRPVTVHLLD